MKRERTKLVRPETPWAPNRVAGLDLLRLFAALLVVLYHYTFQGPAAYGFTWVSMPEVSAVTKYFYLGVPLFFAISGFVIAYSAEGRTVRQFVVARASRIYPGFLICMTLTFLIVANFGAPRITTSVAQWLANLLIAAPVANQEYIDLVYWSIVTEVIFYGLVAITLWLGVFHRRLSLLVAGWLVISVANEVLIGSDVLRRVLITNYSGFFSAGLMLYGLVRGPRSIALWGLLVAATVVGAFQVEWNADWLRDRGVELSPVVVMLLGASTTAVVGAFVLVKRLPFPPALILAVGGLTYPLYLLHQMIGYVIFNHLEGVARPIVLIIGVTLFMLLLSWMIYRFVERPSQAVMRTILSELLRIPAHKKSGVPSDIVQSGRLSPARSDGGAAQVQVIDYEPSRS